ncbi:hexokinase [Aphelenchoides avenae]|nr:hexokinase [Aphelenchus avenae]
MPPGPIKERTRTPTLNSIEKLKSLHKRTSLDVSHSDSVQEACRCFELTDDQLRILMERMNKSFEEGLHPDTASTAAIKMLPSYVRAVSDGTESGDFLALDLGGTNFRVLLVRLAGTESEMTSKIFRVPDHIMKSLFDHIASCLAKFMEEHDLKNREKLPLGFTFSFPCKQEGLTCAKLVNWTKGFKAAGVEGKDVVQLLREACQRRGDIDIDVVAVLNDTTGTMMACAFKENSCNIGVICGTGSNACYMEPLDTIPKLKGEVNPEEDGLPKEMCINTEWGGFGDDGATDFARTKYDRILDENTINPGKQLYEKMISGMYLGELVRIVLEDLAREGHLFHGDFDAIEQKGCFPTKYVSEIEAEMQEDEDNTFQKTTQILEEIGISNVTPTDCANVAYVCSLVSTRAAHLCAVGIATLLNRMKKPYVTVGVDGSVYRFHPTFPELLDQKVDQLIDGNLEYQLMLSEDGSGRGAALVAAVATRMKAQSKAHQERQRNGNNNVKSN